MTPLYYAVETNNLKLTEYLLLRGAFVEWKDIQSSTP
jgi:ankyrin repeat protein